MIEEISYRGWKHNLRLRGPKTELVITLDIGPRIIRYALHDGPNVFTEFSDQIGGAGEKEWMIRGGHRFWTGPEGTHSYELDNGPVKWKKLGDLAVEITQEPSKKFGFQKTMRVEMLADETVRVTHHLTATGDKPLEITPWALSVMALGGTAIVPQPKADSHPIEFPEDRTALPEEYLPNREFILWPYTNLTDGRYVFSENFLRLSYKTGLPASKLGLKVPTGWIAYENKGLVFSKHFVRDPKAPYPDRGVNLELFTNKDIFELESLASLAPLPPGQSRDHIEHWTLRPSPGSLRDEKATLDFFAKLPKI